MARVAGLPESQDQSMHGGAMHAAAPEEMHVLQRQESLAIAQRHIHVQRKLRVTAQALQLQRAPKTQENVSGAATERPACYDMYCI